ncbi:PK beta-barrel-protein domain-containing protein-like protein [Xylariaceae sp. FL0255]|nr:PK beta-barrel-protein domain-containing protein-like protein [Xylariaceae sp. FL0255]
MSPTVLSEVDLYAPFESDVIVEIRTSRMKTMPGTTIQTGIDKQKRSGRIPVSVNGLDADEHDPTFHGGRDKAIHGYCSTHYAQWRREFPESEARFVPGGFGENFVTRRMNERNVCIGDVVSVGNDGVLLQISLPRQPCFKLNHRFRLKNFAPNTYRLSRTGWYYRVLRTGTVQVGDEIRLVERRWPKWTIERVQEYLHRNTDDAAMNAELAEIPDMGEESRKAFAKRVAKLEAKNKREAQANGKATEWMDYKLVEKKQETLRIASFVFESLQPDPEARVKDTALGSHVRLKLPNGLLRSYSVCEGYVNRFQLGISLDENSRGGSAYMHREAKEGDVIQFSQITSDVKPAAAASTHIFIVGGIGITAFLSMMEVYRKINWEVILHLAVRNTSEIPFRDRIDAIGPKIYDASTGSRMDIPAVLRSLPWNSHVYVCGPTRMMDEAKAEAEKCGLGEDEIHFEAFAADTTGDPFEVKVANRGGNVLKVEGEETLLDVLRSQFGGIESSCEVGNCGTCRVAVKCGQVEHRGTALLHEEKKDSMLSCVSRGIGRITIEV